MKFLKNVPLSDYTTYKIGGVAKQFLIVTTVEELSLALAHLNGTNERVIILGKGSNTLFDDRGFNGTVILNKIADIKWEEESVRVGAGYSFAHLGVQTARKGFSGLEFASGIPGTVGGAVYMNAGANGLETKDVIVSVEYLDREGKLHNFPKNDLKFAYRWSMFHDMGGAIVGATFKLTPSSTAKQRQKEILDYRLATQPYKSKTCGCVFRNPEGFSAGKLIDECGLKNMTVGGATISPLHGNFIENRENATANDIIELMTHIRKVVKEKTGIELEEEVCKVPFEEDQDG